MKEKDILRFEGPLGTFFLREDSDKPIIFVASGTGFAPIKSILLHAFHTGAQRQMVLYWGGRRPQDIYMADLCRQWQAEHDNFSFVPVVSEALPEDQWQGRTGFVHSRGDGKTFPTVRLPGLRLRRADRGRVGARGLHHAVPAARGGVLLGRVHPGSGGAKRCSRAEALQDH